MFTIRGKLSDGQTISGTVPSDDMGVAVAAIVKKLPVGLTMSELTIKGAGNAGLSIRKARAPKKAKDAAAPVATPEKTTKK